MNSVLEVKNLCKEYKDFTLKNVNFQLERGYIMGFIGPNGAGKTTTIKLLMNLIKRDSGEIKIFGIDNIKYDKKIKQKIGFVYDDNHFYEELNLVEMKNIIAPFYNNWDNTAFDKYITDFNLPKNKKIKELSKGMKIKYSLVVALSHHAELFIMDEPTSGLDPVFRRELMDILCSIIEDGQNSVLFSTHITADLEKVADFITFINNGNIVFSDSKDTIMDQYRMVKGDNLLLNENVKKQLIGIHKNSFGFEALTNDAKNISKLLKNDVLIERASLEDIMVYTVKGRL